MFTEAKMKKFALLVLIGILTAFSLCSCFGGGGGGGDLPKEAENLIYNATSELYVIIDPALGSELTSELLSELSGYRTEPVNYAAVDSEVHTHEIVIGNTDRAISKTAISRLERVTKDSAEEIAFLIYSDGSSVAVVWEESAEDEDNIIPYLAINKLVDSFISEELILKSGVAADDSVDLIEDHYRVIDQEYRDKAWAAFLSVYGSELTSSFKQLYTLASPESVVWLANLYDPDICVCVDLYGEDKCSGTKYCGTGGFYFSNSGRDNRGYLPDAESTGQAIGLLQILGLAYQRNNDSYFGVLTEDMRQKIGDYIYALEEPNGYFYHPQWSKELVDGLSSRRSRDLSHCVGILQSLGRVPKYTTANGVAGEDSVRASALGLTERLGSGSAIAASAVMLAADSYDPNLQDLSSFRAYLSSLDIKNQSYPVGNTLTAMTGQIQERDRQIGTASDPTPLMDYLIEWLNLNQNPETGTWDYKKPGESGYGAYNGVNGLLKISGIYKAHGVLMPYSREAANSAMAAISDPTPINAVVDIYNAWYTLGNVIKNVRTCGGESGESLAEEIVSELRVDAAETIITTREKLADFIRDDGSASYYKDKSCPVSQGAPVAVSGPVEGDVNATTIAVGQVISLVADALNLSRIHIFGEAERAIFRRTVNNLGSVTKKEEPIPEPFDFENDEIGAAPEGVTLTLGGGSATVKENASGGKMLSLVSHSGSGDTVQFTVGNRSSTGEVFVFEGDFLVNSATGNYSIQLTMGQAYMLTLRVINDELQIWESSSSTGANALEEFLGITPTAGDWFSLRVEYYLGDHDNVRVKVYADTDKTDGEGMKLCAVSDNYYDQNGIKLYHGKGTPSASYDYVRLLAMSATELDMCLDNINCYKTAIKYEKPTANDDPYLNIDPADTDRRVYTFDGSETEAELILSEYARREGGRLLLGSDASVSAPINVRGAGAKCAYISLTASLSQSPRNGATVITASDGGKPVLDILLLSDGEGYATVVPRGAVMGEAIGGVRLPVNEDFKLELEYFHDEDVVIAYINGELAGAASYLYSGGIKSRVDSFTVSCEAGASVSIDDLVCEMKVMSYEDAVAPKVPTRVHEFDRADEDVKLSGSATLSTYGGDGVARIDSSKGVGSITVKANLRSAVVNEAILSLSLEFLSSSGNGETHTIDVVNSEGEAILRFALAYNDGAIELYEVGKSGKMKTPIYIFREKSNITLGFEVFAAERTVYILDDGKRVGKSGVFIGEELREDGIFAASVTSAGVASTLLADSFRFETLYGIFEDVAVNSGVNSSEDISEGLNFESSSSGNIPSSVKNAILGQDSALGVYNLYNGVTDGYSNVLGFTTVAGINDRVSFVKTSDDGYSATAFEADIMLELNSSGYSYQIFFTDQSFTSHAYLIQLEYRNGAVTITDNSSSNNSVGVNKPLYSGILGGEWFKLRVEYYWAADSQDMRIRVFINGTAVCVSDNYYGKENPTSAPKRSFDTVSFYALSACDGTIYLDNLSFLDFNGSCSDAVGQIK